MTVFIFLVFIARSPKQYSYFTGGRGIAFPDCFFFIYIHFSSCNRIWQQKSAPASPALFCRELLALHKLNEAKI